MKSEHMRNEEKAKQQQRMIALSRNSSVWEAVA